MNNNEKVLTGIAVLGAFAMGWFLHKTKPAPSGNVNLHFNPYSVQYEVIDLAGNPWVASTYMPIDATLEPGDYTVDMTALGG